jgi:hypothetical protein
MKHRPLPIIVASSLVLFSCSTTSSSTDAHIAEMTVLSQRMDRFSEEQTVSCMKVAGWPWFQKERSMIPMEEVAGVDFGMSPLTEVTILSLRMETGEVVQPKRENDLRRSQMNPTELQAFKDQLSSCKAKIDLALEPIRLKLLSAQSSQPPPIASSSAEDPATKKWARCMQNEGYRFRTMNDMSVAIQNKISSAGRDIKILSTQVKTFETQVRTTNSLCYKKVEKAVREQYNSTNRDKLKKMAEFETEALDEMTKLEESVTK